MLNKTWVNRWASSEVTKLNRGKSKPHLGDIREALADFLETLASHDEESVLKLVRKYKVKRKRR